MWRRGPLPTAHLEFVLPVLVLDHQTLELGRLPRDRRLAPLRQLPLGRLQLRVQRRAPHVELVGRTRCKRCSRERLV